MRCAILCSNEEQGSVIEYNIISTLLHMLNLGLMWNDKYCRFDGVLVFDIITDIPNNGLGYDRFIEYRAYNQVLRKALKNGIVLRSLSDTTSIVLNQCDARFFYSDACYTVCSLLHGYMLDKNEFYKDYEDCSNAKHKL